ncbi:MAG: hypothetical protein HY538_05200 [Deltaproteobacteria bacterium]|nr:hypothetical protein [Deltaproteobacteria bacterium]
MLELLQERLGLPSKAQVIHRALGELQGIVNRARLAQEIEASVRKCRKADEKEHRLLTGAAFHRGEED